MSAVAFNGILRNLGIQYKFRNTWILYQKYAKNGYTHCNVFVAPNGNQSVHTCWTQKGRIFLYEILAENSVLPMIERTVDYAN